MKRLIVITAVLIVLVIPMGMGTIVVERAAPIVSPIEPSGKLRDLRVAVVPSLPFGELAVDYLRRTELFGEVVAGNDESADLTFHVREARDNFGCGLPYLATLVTLGLIPNRGEEPFRFVTMIRGNNRRLDFEAGTRAKSIIGLWALVLRPTRRWSSWDSGDKQEDFAAFLRQRLLEREAELVALAGSP